jgi:hypothetical protein
MEAQDISCYEDTNNKRPLTKSAIEKLCGRFNIRPDFLFSIS